jgi:hypothetical protein
MILACVLLFFKSPHGIRSDRDLAASQDEKLENVIKKQEGIFPPAFLMPLPKDKRLFYQLAEI